jgi:hypothetical protein
MCPVVLKYEYCSTTEVHGNKKSNVLLQYSVLLYSRTSQICHWVAMLARWMLIAESRLLTAAIRVHSSQFTLSFVHGQGKRESVCVILESNRELRTELGSQFVLYSGSRNNEPHNDVRFV